MGQRGVALAILFALSIGGNLIAGDEKRGREEQAPKVLDTTISPIQIGLQTFEPVMIESSDVSPNGLTISEPGAYLFSEDIEFGGKDFAITIDADNVFLDMNAKVFSPSGALSNGDKRSAIHVKADRSKITIKNGCIQDFENDGIRVDEGCSEVTINNVLLTRCDGKAIRCEGTVDKHIVDSIIEECWVTCCTGKNILPEKDSGAFCLRLCDNFKVFKCCVNENGNDNEGFAAIVLERCDKCEVRDCQANCNFGKQIMTAYKLTDINNCLFENCTARKNESKATVGQVYGFNMKELLHGNVFKNSSALDNTAGRQAFGFNCASDSQGSLFIECEALRQYASDTVIGFASINSDKNQFHQCRALAQGTGSGSQPKDGAGFHLHEANGTVLEECEADDTRAAHGDGIRLILSDRCHMRNCQALRNDR